MAEVAVHPVRGDQRKIRRLYFKLKIILERIDESLCSCREEPACAPEDLPDLDAVILSHLHGDHFDREARRRLDRDPPVLSTPHAVRRLDRWGFDGRALATWERHELHKGEETLSVTAVPGVHARGVMGRLLPPVMGSMLEHSVGGRVARRVYLSGDTLPGAHVREVGERFGPIDAAVVHLGGTRVLFHTVTMDDRMGLEFLEQCRPSTVVPVHHDDYRVFRSPLSDFVDRVRAHGLEARLRIPARGETVSLDPATA